jgi:type I restriction enzyme M protein
MTAQEQQLLGKTLWTIANQLHGTINANDFRDYMLSFIFLRYLSDEYESVAKKELGDDYPETEANDGRGGLSVWHETNPEDVPEFERLMLRRVHYVVKPQYLWNNIAELARTQNGDLLKTLQNGFKQIENESFENTFHGLFSEINSALEKLGNNYTDRNSKLCTVITKIAEGINRFSADSDTLGDACEYLAGQFVADLGRRTGERYTPQPIAAILSEIVTMDGEPSAGKKTKLDKVLDFACGSGSLLLNVRRRIGNRGVGKMYGQEKNAATCNLARMNMLVHGVKDSEFEIHRGDSLLNDWDILNETNPAKKLKFDAIVATPPFNLEWKPAKDAGEDLRFKGYGLAPRSTADFAFLLHGFHFLSDEGTMAIVLTHGVLFRGGVEEHIRAKLLKDGNIDAVIALPANLFFFTGTLVCIIVLKKCKKTDDILFINAAKYFEKGKRQNSLRREDVEKIVETYRFRKEEDGYSRRVPMEEIGKNDYNLNISRYVSSDMSEEIIDLKAVSDRLINIEKQIVEAADKHNRFLKELGLPPV